MLAACGWAGFEAHLTVTPSARSRRRARFTIGPVIERPPGHTPPPSVAASPPHRDRKAIDVNLLDSQQAVLRVTGFDKEGNPVDPTALGALTWTSSDPSVLTLTDNGDGTQTAVTTGVLGDAQVTVTDDVNGDGTGEFTGSLAFVVTAGPVAEITVTAGVPTDRP